ncbi:TRAM1-like protein [Penicillium citrinum]|uniref:TRAM1-like protein n=2 Tax=Penicillium TaxID=5073 RepID=A0A9W9NX90_PENCI|nr:TRAM1-like protein [Penicillium citrinum]KAJ5231484.1 TRAM1-like protein [Penicillium citrinum]KAJ5579017.1 TRAM1-like protein [Penicillium hetheringtonii]
MNTRQRKVEPHTNGNAKANGKSNSNGHAITNKQIQSSTPKRKQRSLLRRLKRRALKYTWSIPLALIITLLSLYAINPTESNILHKFIFLSYAQEPDPSSTLNIERTQYGKGPWDIAFVAFYALVLTFTREFIMQQILAPFARSRFAGIKSRGKQQRCMEQMYTAIYFGVTGPAGLYVMRQTPVWYFRTRGMYELFPHKTHFAEFKFYYLFEAAYWAQQALVMLLGLEKPRKDFRELVAHHIVTLALIGLSYRFHFTYIGIAVYITHDVSDFFLAISKTFHYINSELVVPFYALNVFTWIYLRHYLNLRILWSLLTEFQTVGPYELNWETQQYKCWISNVITFALLAMLQSLNLFWLYCLMRSAWKFIAYGEKKDDRSEESELEVLADQHGGKDTKQL